MELTKRPRRLRRSEAVRSLVRETHLRVDDLIHPLFVTEGEKTRAPIDDMPGQYRFSVDELVDECRELWDLGIPAVNLFGYSTEKDDQATQSYDPQGLIQRAIRSLKAAVPELCVQTDVALDPYTHHGHDGLVVDGESSKRRDHRGAVQDGPVARRSGRRLGRALRHDGWPGRRHPPGTRRGWI